MNVVEARKRADAVHKNVDDDRGVATILKQVELAADQGLYKTIVDVEVAVR